MNISIIDPYENEDDDGKRIVLCVNAVGGSDRRPFISHFIFSVLSYMMRISGNQVDNRMQIVFPFRSFNQYDMHKLKMPTEDKFTVMDMDDYYYL